MSNDVDIKTLAEYYANRLLYNEYNDRVLFSTYFRQKLSIYFGNSSIRFGEKDRPSLKMRLINISYTKPNKIYVESYENGIIVALRLISVFKIPDYAIEITELKNKKEGQYTHIVEFTLTPEDFVKICKKCPGFVYDAYYDYNEKGEYLIKA